jgi:hypothetical protein
MDTDRFDRLARMFGTSSRRQLLRPLVGTAFAGTLLVSESQDSVARCRRRRRCPDPIGCCPRGTRCLHEVCFTKSTCPSGFDCGSAPACHAQFGGNCFCGRTTEGQIICHQNYQYCANPIPCTKTSECDPGRVCLDITTCNNCSSEVGTCVEPCPDPA